MGRIDYRAIYERNKHGWYDMTEEPQKYEALLAGHYSDSNHFVYELLQNAEDENASKVVFEYYKDKLVFYHNGEPFDEADVRGVSSMLAGTKDKDEAQQIGRFGMGFKSVFKYTYQPEIYSDNEAFRIESYLLPVEIKEIWNYEEEKEKLCYERNSGGRFYPFMGVKHLTKIVIPFAKKDDKGQVKSVSGKEVLRKLEGLTGEILLFLSTVKSLYWVDKETGQYSMISLNREKDDPNLLTCRIEGSSLGKKEHIIRYLKYVKVFDHPDMKAAQVSVAYRVNNRMNNVNEMPGTDIWVYFPTRDHTSLPFLIHGSFETAVSREKLMAPSDFNQDLFDELGNLICESLLDLRERKLITQAFIRHILIAAFKDEEENNTMPGLKRKVTELFMKMPLLPDKEGNNRMVSELTIPVPFEIAQFYEKELFKPSFKNVKGFVVINNAKELNFTEYFCWLRDELNVQVYHLSDWAEDLKGMAHVCISNNGKDLSTLEEFYDFLSDNRESVYNTNSSHSRSGAYESTIKQNITQAWLRLRKAPIILNGENQLIAAFVNNKANIYLNASSKYKRMVAASIVNSKITGKYQRLLEDGFQLSAFDNFQYIKEKVIKKYIDIDSTIAFEAEDDYVSEYIEDVTQILELMEESDSYQPIVDMVKNAYIIKIRSEEDEDLFERPENVYVDGFGNIDLDTYYMPVPCRNGRTETFGLSHIDTDFYEQYGISIQKLTKLGLVTTPVNEGTRSADGVGDGHWTALGEYCPYIEIDGLESNIDFIEMYPEKELARKKSTVILKLLLSISDKLKGTVRYRKNNPYEQEEEAYILNYVRRSEWLFDKNENLNQCISMSKFDLNTEIYGSVSVNKEAYKILGFIESKDDTKEKTYEMVEALDNREQKILLRNLARKLGVLVVEDEDCCGQEEKFDENEGQDFQLNDWYASEFPRNRVRNMDILIEHVRQQFYCADPTVYREVLRQIRVSKSPKIVRAYAIGMYTNESDMHICQMCQQPSQLIDATEISNYGIEMPQLTLCLCRNCSGKYKLLRDKNRSSFKEQIRQAIKRMDVEVDSDKYELQLNSDMSLYFTQTHLAEIQTIFQMLEEYGTPQDEAKTNVSIQEKRKKTNRFQIQSSLQQGIFSDDVIHEGSFVRYKKLATGECVDNTVHPKKFPFHRKLLGKKMGDVIEWQGKKYEIINII